MEGWRKERESREEMGEIEWGEEGRGSKDERRGEAERWREEKRRGGEAERGEEARRRGMGK